MYPQGGFSGLESFQFSSVQSLSQVWLFVNPWTAACQASLSITNSQSLPKLMSIESVMLSNHFILYRPLLLLPSIFPSLRVFSDESALHIRWPKYWSFSFSISPSNEHPGLLSFRMRLVGSPCSPRDSQESSPTQWNILKSTIATLFHGLSPGCLKSIMEIRQGYESYWSRVFAETCLSYSYS